MALSSDLHRRAMEPLASAAALPSSIGEGAEGELLAGHSTDLRDEISSDDPLLDPEWDRPNPDGTTLVLADDPAFDWTLPIERGGRSIDSGEPILGDATGNPAAPAPDRPQADHSPASTPSLTDGAEQSFRILEGACGCDEADGSSAQNATQSLTATPSQLAGSTFVCALENIVKTPAGPGPEVVLPPTHPVPRSGDVFIDALLYSDPGEDVLKWGSEPAGSPTTVTYSFPDFDSSWADYGGAPLNFLPFSEDQKAAVRVATKLWDDVSNIQILEVPDIGDSYGLMRFSNVELDFGSAQGNPPGYYEDLRDGDIWIDFDQIFNYAVGEVGFQLVIHEIGHALGLGHPHQGTPPLPCEQDFHATTIMSYRNYPCDNPGDGATANYRPVTPMTLDIGAMQYLYGVDTTTRTGDDVYSWAVGKPQLEAIWDAGGTDAIDWSNQVVNASIDLQPGSWSVLGQPYSWTADGGGSFPGTVAIAKGVTIENAFGGAGDDVITGNDVNNRLTGGSGADVADGGEGADTLEGGEGDDSLFGAADGDVMDGDAGADLLDGGAGGDLILGGAGADRLWGRADGDSLDGGLGDDVLIDDRQAAGAPSISPSDDYLAGNAGADLMDGGPGDDFLSGLGDDGGRDLFVFTMQPAGPDRPLATIAPGRDKVELFASGEDALRFVHDPDAPGGPNPYTLANMLLEQNGADLVISFSGLPRAETEVTLLDVALPSLATGAIEFESFPGQVEVPQLYVFGASQVRSTVFAPNATTWLNQLNNSVTGFEGGNDVINGQGGNDVLRGLAGHDLLRGEQGADYLLGGRGNDRLEGGGGNDRLRGDFGDDLLLGGAGADRFEFVADRGHDLGADFIADFERGPDDVVLRLAGGFASLDSNGNGVLDEPDAAVAISAGSTVVTLGAGAYNPVQFTVAGIDDLHSADFLFV